MKITANILTNSPSLDGNVSTDGINISGSLEVGNYDPNNIKIRVENLENNAVGSIYLNYNQSTSVLTLTTKNTKDEDIGTARTITLPSGIKNVSYSNETKSITIVLTTDQTLTVSLKSSFDALAEIYVPQTRTINNKSLTQNISLTPQDVGAQAEITSNNKLDADLTQDGINNKVFTSSDKSKLNGIEAGAQVNVQADWNQTNENADDYIKNKPSNISNQKIKVGNVSFNDNAEINLVPGNNVSIDANSTDDTITINATDTTYENKQAVEDGQDVSLVTTGEKYNWNAKYNKPNDGIPKTDLSNGVQTSLDKADSALQSISSTDVTNALGYIPYNSTNPNGYTKVESSNTNGNIKINGNETQVYSLPNDVARDSDISDINDKFQSGVTSSNPAVSESFVNSSINSLAAFFITRTAAGDNFNTYAQLINATTFYSGGQARIPTQNDYTYIRYDENKGEAISGYSSFTTTSDYIGYIVIYSNEGVEVTSSNKDSLGIIPGTTVAYENLPTTRYSYQGGTYPNGQWDFQVIVNNSALTAAQMAALNSGIDSTKVEQIETNKNNISDLSNRVTTVETGVSNIPNNYVSYSGAQTLNSTQQAQARSNIGAGTSSFSGNYSDLSNKPTIPTKTSDLQNDSGFINSVKTLNTTNTSAQSTSSSESLSGSGTLNLHKVSKTGSYNDLNDKPTIPVDTNTWRPIKVNGVQKLSGDISSNALDLVAGTNVSLSENDGEVTINVNNSSSTDVQVDSNSITQGDVANLHTINGDYNASTNKLATENDLPINYVAFTQQTLTTEQKTQARTNIGAGTSNFNGNYHNLIARPEVLICQTAASTAGKVANADSYTTPPVKGIFYFITFTNGNTVTENLTLSLGSNEPTYSLEGVGEIGSGGSVLVYFDGTEFKKFGLSDTPYYHFSLYTQKSGTSYLAKNLTMCIVYVDSSISGSLSNTSWLKAYISKNGTTWQQVGYTGSTSGYPKFEALSFVIPKGWYFKWEQTGCGSSGNNVSAIVYSLAN